jgi:hypothetical protein
MVRQGWVVVPAQTGQAIMARLFFSEEKNQKTFASRPVPPSPAMARICTLAQT